MFRNSHRAAAIPLLLVLAGWISPAEVTAASPLLPDNPEIEVSAGPRMAPGGQTAEVEVALRQRFEIADERGLRIQAAERTRDRHATALEQARWRVHRSIHASFHASFHAALVVLPVIYAMVEERVR